MNGLKVNGLAVIGLAAMLLTGCHQTAPQTPSQRRSGSGVTMPGKQQADSATLALLAFNQQMTAKADETIRPLVQQQAEPYALYESGTWLTILDKGDEAQGAPAPGEEWTVHMKIYDLDNHLLVDSEKSYVIGKRELPDAVDMNIGVLYKHGRARMYAPWYAAYGVSGTADIAPYENIIIEIELK